MTVELGPGENAMIICRQNYPSSKKGVEWFAFPPKLAIKASVD